MVSRGSSTSPCSTPRCTSAPCSGNRTTAPCLWCCCTSATRTRGREATSPPSTRTSTSTYPTAYPSSATARCSPLPGRRSASPLPPSSCTVPTALGCPSCTG